VLLAFDLLTSNLIEIFFVPWIVHMCYIVSLSGKDNTVESGNHISTSMSKAVDLGTSNSIGNIFLLWVVQMCDMANDLKPGNRIFPSMYCALDF
jgi:hypothetical protein